MLSIEIGMRLSKNKFLGLSFKNLRTLFCSLCFIFISNNNFSQPSLDTITACLKKKPQIFAKLDSRNSFIANSRAKIFGVKLGLSYCKRVHFGVGYNQLYPPATDFNKKIYVNENTLLKDSAIAKLNMFYFSAHVEYIYYQTKHWELSIPLQIGIGKTNYKYIYLDEKYRIEDTFNFIYEPAISVEYKPIKWIGIGADIGYRFMVTDYRKLNQKFNSPTYAFKFLIYYSEIFKSVFPKSKLVNKFK